MTLTLTPFDPMMYLDSAEDHIALLNDAFATGERNVIIGVIGMIARARGITDLAKTSGIGRSSLYKSLDKAGNPTLDTFLTILDALGLELRAAARTPAAAE